MCYIIKYQYLILQSKLNVYRARGFLHQADINSSSFKHSNTLSPKRSDTVTPEKNREKLRREKSSLQNSKTQSKEYITLCWKLLLEVPFIATI